MCFDGNKRLCHIRGKLRKKVWINNSDIILASYPTRWPSMRTTQTRMTLNSTTWMST